MDRCYADAIFSVANMGATLADYQALPPGHTATLLAQLARELGSSLAALIKRSWANHQPIIVTQKGYPTGVILDIELFTALRQLADQHLRRPSGEEPDQEA